MFHEAIIMVLALVLLVMLITDGEYYGMSPLHFFLFFILAGMTQ